jgi:hypothetical protein
MTELDAALDEINRLRAAIIAHRADLCGSSDPVNIRDIELWLALKEN